MVRSTISRGINGSRSPTQNATTMKSDTSRSEPHRPVDEPERDTNDVSIELKRLAPILENTARQRNELQQALVAVERQREQLQDQLDAERAGCDQLVESARILASYAQRLDETLEGILRSKRLRAGNYLGKLYQKTIPPAIRPYVMSVARKLFRLSSKWVPEGKLADLDVVNPWLKRWSWNDVHLAQTAGTDVKCRTCIGSKYVWHLDEFQVPEYLTICPNCNGTKRMVSF